MGNLITDKQDVAPWMDVYTVKRLQVIYDIENPHDKKSGDSKYTNKIPIKSTATEQCHLACLSQKYQGFQTQDAKFKEG